MNSKQALPAATNACRLRMDNTIPDQTDNGNDSGVGSASCSPTIEHISGANVTYGSPTSRITGFNLNAVMSSPVQQNESQSMRFETPPSSISPVSVPMSSPDSEINGNQADLDNRDALARLQSLRGNDYLYGNTSPNDMANRNKGRQNRVPTVNSHGKIKIYKCKQCAFKATTKNEYWIHCNIHIDPEKRLECPKCIFVTEYKHHLEYHMANHSGLKPFKCLQCKYTCVSKSMLTSHLKSHSKVHQFNCKDCGYSTKYIHSLKTHLRKLKHKRVLILNPDGTPNPNMVVDVNGSRRGPRTKRPAQSPPTQPTAPGPEAIMQHSFNQLMMATAPLRYSLYPLFNPIPAAAIANTLLLQNLERLTTNETCNETLNETRNDSLMEYEVLDLSTSNRNRNQPSTARLEEDTDGEVVQVQSTQTKYYQYHCQYCEMTFGNATMHAMHMRFHGSSRYPFTCSMCGVINKDAITFFNHIAQQQHL